MANRGPNPDMNKLPDEESVPPEVRHTWRGLARWLKTNRWDRGIPEKGIMPAIQFHECSDGCILHDRKS